MSDELLKELIAAVKELRFAIEQSKQPQVVYHQWQYGAGHIYPGYWPPNYINPPYYITSCGVGGSSSGGLEAEGH